MLNVKPLLPVKRRNVNACLPVVDLGDMGKGIIHPAYSNISYRRVEKKSKTRKKNNFLASTGIVGRNNFELDRSINVNVGVPGKNGRFSFQLLHRIYFWSIRNKSYSSVKIQWVDCRNTPDFAVAGFSAPAAGVLSFCSMFVVVVTGATVAGGLVLLVALLAKGAAAGCLGVTVVLLGVGLCTVDAAAGLGVGLGATAGILEVTGLAGLGGAVFTTGGLLATGVVDWMVVDMTLGTACFSWFTTGGGFGEGTAKAGRNGFESPCSNLYIFSSLVI